MHVDKKSISYGVMKLVYEDVFGKLTRTENTLFENSEYKPNFDKIYEQFINDSEAYLLFTESSQSQKYKIAQQWILENVFFEAVDNVYHNVVVVQEDDSIRNRFLIDNTYKVLHEVAFTTILGGALGSIIAYSLLPDAARKYFETLLTEAGRFVSKVLTLDLSEMEIDRKTLAQLRATALADSIKECKQVTNYDIHKSSKFTRAWDRITGQNRQYSYARCIGNKLIKYYKDVFETTLTILKSMERNRQIDTQIGNLASTGRLGSHVLSNIARLVKDRKLSMVLKTVDEINKTILDMLKEFSESNDPEYRRIGAELSREYEQVIRDIARGYMNDRQRPAMNKRDEKMVREQTGGYKPYKGNNEPPKEEKKEEKNVQVPTSRNNPF